MLLSGTEIRWGLGPIALRFGEGLQNLKTKAQLTLEMLARFNIQCIQNIRKTNKKQLTNKSGPESLSIIAISSR